MKQTFVSVHGIGRHYAKPVQLGEARRHCASNSISQIFEIWIAADIGERKNGDGVNVRASAVHHIRRR